MERINTERKENTQNANNMPAGEGGGSNGIHRIQLHSFHQVHLPV
jgi:hypothetical protein